VSPFLLVYFCSVSRFRLMVLLGCVIASSASAEVVDEETGKPLEGAVVTVIWCRAPLVYMDLVRRFRVHRRP
jgi:hypothetical protein